MRKEVILVPKDKCPLDILAEMGKETRNAWIFLHRNAVNKLISSADLTVIDAKFYELHWEATDEVPETKVIIRAEVGVDWLQILSIEADDIAFKERNADPADILFLRMSSDN